jgi:transcriptional regulator GlxA family with amidase domain
MSVKSRIVWFLTPQGTELLDVAGPWEVFGHANDVLEREVYRLLIATGSGGKMRTRHGLHIAQTLPLRSLRGRPHTVIVAGGSPHLPNEIKLIKYLRHIGETPRIASICTGAFVLAEAGILDGRRATTHWRFINKLRERFPKVLVEDKGIFVKDGNVWTSAGITAGIDLALAFVEEDCGHQVAMEVARNLLLFLRRSGRQAQFSGLLQRQEKEPARLRDLHAFVDEHLDETLSVERLAEQLAMSPRSMSRWFQKEVKETPAGFVRNVRLQEAKRLLSESDLGLTDIASRTGLGDLSTLWRAFIRQLGLSPEDYRKRFNKNSSELA